MKILFRDDRFRYFCFSENLMKNLTDPDPQKNLLTLATKLVELQEQSRLNHSKINEIEKRSTILMRERDQILLENSRVTAAKTKLESLCRELHKHNQQIRVRTILASIRFSLRAFFFNRMKVFNDNRMMKPNDENWLRNFKYLFLFRR